MTELAPGIHFDIPATDYHALSYVSSSVLKRLYTSSAKHVHERPVESSEAMDNGTAFHAMLLNRDFHSRFFVLPEGPINPITEKPFRTDTKRYEQWLSSVLSCNVGKAPVDLAVVKNIEGAIAAFRDHPYGAEIAGRIASKQAKTEVTLIWDEEAQELECAHVGGGVNEIRDKSGVFIGTTFRCKARLDILDPVTQISFEELSKPYYEQQSRERFYIRDPKTTRNANPKKFMWDVLPTREGLNYWIQAAWYYRGAKANGLDVTGFEFIAIELERPHGISFNGLDESELDSAQAPVRRLALHWATCQATGIYTGYPVVRNMLALKGDEE